MNTNETQHTKKRQRVLPCVCDHATQDALHGPGNRVHNPCKNGYRCTVCARVKEGK